MEDLEKEKKAKIIDKLREYMTRQRNVLLLTIVISFVGVNVFFFSSSAIFKDTKDYPSTPLGQQQFLYGDHAFTITRWEYSAAEHKMELELEVENTANDGLDNYAFSAVTIPDGNASVKPVIEEFNYLVIQIENLPAKFSAISFRVKIDNEGYDDQLKLYTNANSVTHVESLPAKSREDYYIQRIERNIGRYQEQITKKEQTIQSLKEQINVLKANIAKLEEDQKYLVADEIEKNNQLIRTNQSKIADLEAQIKEVEADTTENKKKIEQAKEKLKGKDGSADVQK